MSENLGKNLCIIIPTRNRPHKIFKLLDSILNQKITIRRIIIIDSGSSIESTIKKFNNRLPIEYYRTKLKGQIVQRNIAISKLKKKDTLVASFDDDIILSKGSLKKILKFWKNSSQKKAAVSFNIINEKPITHNFFFGLMGISGNKPGKVLKSGINTSIVSLKKNIKTDWVSGGATIWKKEFLIKYKHEEFVSKWSPCEDLIFSYPIGKKYPLYVCSEAHVKHEHEYDIINNFKYNYYGYVETVWRYYFVKSHSELSLFKFFKAISFMIFIRFLMSIIKLSSKHLQFGLGQLNALVKIFILGKDLKKLLND